VRKEQPSSIKGENMDESLEDRIYDLQVLSRKCQIRCDGCDWCCGGSDEWYHLTHIMEKNKVAEFERKNEESAYLNKRK
tara:strand:- start:418 stop:654 length:237 start_codon:yes stop_codon:yes gene_type:complete